MVEPVHCKAFVGNLGSEGAINPIGSTDLAYCGWDIAVGDI